MTRSGMDEMSRVLGRIEEKTDHMHECLHDMKEKVDQLDTGFQDLQRLRAKGAGMLLGVAIASGFLGSKLGWLGHIASKLTGN